MRIKYTKTEKEANALLLENIDLTEFSDDELCSLWNKMGHKVWPSEFKWIPSGYTFMEDGRSYNPKGIQKWKEENTKTKGLYLRIMIDKIERIVGERKIQYWVGKNLYKLSDEEMEDYYKNVC